MPGVSLLEPGTRVPLFHTQDQYGRDVSLQDWLGQPVLICFFAFAFSSVCRRELQALRDMHYLFEAAGCRVVGVSTDTTFALREFSQQVGIQYSLLTDHWPHGAIGASMGAFDDNLGFNHRCTVLLDGDGRVVWTELGDLPVARDFSHALSAVHSLLPEQ